MLSTVKDYAKRREVQLIALIILLSTLSFGLGYLYARQENPAPILIQKVSK